MILSSVLAHHEGALRASLRAVYGIDLREARATMLATDLADLVAWLPAGCALWLDVGGPASLTVEAHELRAIEYRLRVLAWLQSKDGSDGKNRPTPPEPIKWAHERRADEQVMDRKARAFLERQKRLQGR